MNLVERIQQPTPKLFQSLRAIGLVAATIGGVLLTAPVVLPSVLVTIGGYLVLAGGVVSAVSQLTVDDSKSDVSSATR